MTQARPMFLLMLANDLRCRSRIGDSLSNKAINFSFGCRRKTLAALVFLVAVWREITATMRRAKEHDSFGRRVHSAQFLVLLVEVVLG